MVYILLLKSKLTLHVHLIYATESFHISFHLFLNQVNLFLKQGLLGWGNELPLKFCMC